MKKELLLFLTSNYPIERVNKDIIKNKYNLFDEIKLLNENDLDDYIKPIVESNIIKYHNDNYPLRGYGYWIWKPYIILQELNKLQEGDILVYLDVHCIDDNLKDKFNDIIDKLQYQSIIIGTAGFNDYMYTTTKLRQHIEHFLNYKFTIEQLNDTQYEAGIIFIRNCVNSHNFIKQWFDIMMSNLDCITDIYDNDSENHETFIANRHDQSVISLLYKFYNYMTPDYLNWDFMHIK